MNIRIGILGLFLGIAALGLYGEEKVYLVQKGETFYSIARAMGIKADDLMKYNGITDPSRLQAGQRLRIPAAAGQSARAEAVSAEGARAMYRVVRGDTLYSIARKFTLTVEDLRELNGLSPAYVLREGDSLKLSREGGLSGNAGTAARTPLPQTGDRTEPRDIESRPVNPSVRWPVTALELSYMTGKLNGVVITAARSEPVKSLTRGTVLSAGPFQGFGRVAIIQVEGGYLYVYGGCESLSIKEGDTVSPGTELGKLGIDAISNKPRLFFMVYRSNTPIDPAKAPRA